MDNKEKLQQQISRDSEWAKIREEQGIVYSTLASICWASDYPVIHLHEGTASIFIRCLNLIINDVILYKEKYEIAAQTIKPKRLNFVLNNIKKINNDSLTIENRVKCIERIRDYIWTVKYLSIVEMIHSVEAITRIRTCILKNMQKTPQEILDLLPADVVQTLEDNSLLILSCLQMVLIEIKLQDAEISIIEGTYTVPLDAKDLFGADE